MYGHISFLRFTIKERAQIQMTLILSNCYILCLNNTLLSCHWNKTKLAVLLIVLKIKGKFFNKLGVLLSESELAVVRIHPFFTKHLGCILWTKLKNSQANKQNEVTCKNIVRFSNLMKLNFYYVSTGAKYYFKRKKRNERNTHTMRVEPVNILIS